MAVTNGTSNNDERTLKPADLRSWQRLMTSCRSLDAWNASYASSSIAPRIFLGPALILPWVRRKEMVGEKILTFG
jgi:hypothetical protein